jgi:hypothetical protein
MFTLPAITAIASAAAIAAAATTTASAVATSTAPSATAAAASASSAPVTSTSTTTPAAFRLRLGFIDDQIAAAEVLPVEGIDGLLCVWVAGNFNERESARLSGEAIANEIDGGRSDTNLREPLVELIFRGGKWKVANVELLHLLTPSARNPLASRGAR